MTNVVPAGGVHHITLTVTDVQRSCEFYTTVLNFQPIGEFGPGMRLSNGSMVLIVSPPDDSMYAPSGDQFDEIA